MKYDIDAIVFNGLQIRKGIPFDIINPDWLRIFKSNVKQI